MKKLLVVLLVSIISIGCNKRLNPIPPPDDKLPGTNTQETLLSQARSSTGPSMPIPDAGKHDAVPPVPKHEVSQINNTQPKIDVPIIDEPINKTEEVVVNNTAVNETEKKNWFFSEGHEISVMDAVKGTGVIIGAMLVLYAMECVRERCTAAPLTTDPQIGNGPPAGQEAAANPPLGEPANNAPPAGNANPPANP